jgi:hypothetical protein
MGCCCPPLYFFFFSQDRQLHLEDEWDAAVDPHFVDHCMSSSFLRIGSSILRMNGMLLLTTLFLLLFSGSAAPS